MKIIIEMNLSPAWTDVFGRAGLDAEHWSRISAASAPDAVILANARDRGAIVFTHDLEFGRLLALTHAEGPSVVQVRGADVTPDGIGALVVLAMRQSMADLRSNALVMIDATTNRTRAAAEGLSTHCRSTSGDARRE